MGFQTATKYETTILNERMLAGFSLADFAVQRFSGITQGDGSVLCLCETNDDNDDGYPDGQWVNWQERYRNADDFTNRKGPCHIGVSGVVVTVSLDGRELK